MRDEMVWMFIGIFMTFAVMVLLTNEPLGIANNANSLIEECEKELPRNQTCILTAIPGGEINE